MKQKKPEQPVWLLEPLLNMSPPFNFLSPPSPPKKICFLRWLIILIVFSGWEKELSQAMKEKKNSIDNRIFIFSVGMGNYWKQMLFFLSRCSSQLFGMASCFVHLPHHHREGSCPHIIGWDSQVKGSTLSSGSLFQVNTIYKHVVTGVGELSFSRIISLTSRLPWSMEQSVSYQEAWSRNKPPLGGTLHLGFLPSFSAWPQWLWSLH